LGLKKATGANVTVFWYLAAFGLFAGCGKIDVARTAKARRRPDSAKSETIVYRPPNITFSTDVAIPKKHRE
jgi:hypothetical protein